MNRDTDSVVVIKVGGSLLSTPGAIGMISRWLTDTRLAGETRVLLVGGGAPVDGLRAIDSANPASTAAMHQAAIDAMDAHARLLAAWLPDVRFTACLPRPLAWRQPLVATDWVLAPGQWLKRSEPAANGPRLRAGWDTTSDAIAARVAAVIDARLVLLKHSVTATYDEKSIDAAAAAGVVDPETPRLVRDAGIPVRVLGVSLPGLPSGLQFSPQR